MEVAPAESLAIAFAFLDAASLVQLGTACSYFSAVAYADRIWLPLVARRWRFGRSPASADTLSPGARTEASDCALATAIIEPLGRRTDTFGFYVTRCRQDADVGLLVAQFDAALARLDGDAKGSRVGSRVRVEGLVAASQYNGCEAVVVGEAERVSVLLASLHPLSIKGENLVELCPAIAAEDSAREAERQLVEQGGDAIDALLRLSGSGVKGSAAHSLKRLLATVKTSWATQQWKSLLRDTGRADLLEEGGLIVAQWAEPSTDADAVRGILSDLAESAAARATNDAPILERIEAVHAVLFEEYGLVGNAGDYYDPNNSFLHCVLERRRGIPISLSIVWAAVARRIDIPCFLCAQMPGHVVIRVTVGKSPQTDLYVDAFNRKVLDWNGLSQFVLSMGVPLLQDDYVAERVATAIYSRVLRNLVGIYRRALREPTVECIQPLMGVCAQVIAVSDSAAHAEVEEFRLLYEHLEGTMMPRMSRYGRPRSG